MKWLLFLVALVGLAQTDDIGSIKCDDPKLKPVLIEAAHRWGIDVRKLALKEIKWCDPTACPILLPMPFSYVPYLAYTTNDTIILDRTALWDTTPNNDLVGTVTHELGHVMGLPHIPKTAGPAVMNPDGPTNFPTWLDRQALAIRVLMTMRH